MLWLVCFRVAICFSLALGHRRETQVQHLESRFIDSGLASKLFRHNRSSGGEDSRFEELQQNDREVADFEQNDTEDADFEISLQGSTSDETELADSHNDSALIDSAILGARSVSLDGHTRNFSRYHSTQRADAEPSSASLAKSVGAQGTLAVVALRNAARKFASRLRTSFYESNFSYSLVVTAVILVLGCCLGTWFFRAHQRDLDTSSSRVVRKNVPDSSSDSESEPEPQGPRFVDFQCPAGFGPGDLVQVPLPNGASKRVRIPPGVKSGMMFSVRT